MALTIDASVGGSSSNSYCTLAEAETYHEGRLNNTDWTGATTDNKNRALSTATRLLDEWVRWEGSTNTSTQALQWPRYDVLDRHGVEFSALIIPSFLKDATAELALFLLGEDRTTDPDTKGFSSISAGPVSLTIDKQDRRAVLPESVQSMVRFYGIVQSRMANVKRLVRA